MREVDSSEAGGSSLKPAPFADFLSAVIQQTTTLQQHPICAQADEVEFESHSLRLPTPSVHVASPGRLAAAAEALFEELLELGVEDGVDDGVESAVDVAQPGDGAHQAGRDAAGQAQSARRVHHEERRPAEQKAAWGKQDGGGV